MSECPYKRGEQCWGRKHIAACDYGLGDGCNQYKPSDPVHHPAHYTFGGIEVLDAIEAWKLPYHVQAIQSIGQGGNT